MGTRDAELRRAEPRRHGMGANALGAAVDEVAAAYTLLDADDVLDRLARMPHAKRRRVEADAIGPAPATIEAFPVKGSASRVVERQAVQAHGLGPSSAPLEATSQLACANPSCWYLVHEEPGFGGFCCKKCAWCHDTGSRCKKKHGHKCAQREAHPGAARAEPVQPDNAWGD